MKARFRDLTFFSVAILLVSGMIGNIGFCSEPLGVPDPEDIEYPNEEPPTAEEILLGKILFFDKRLSINNQTSCASCHNPDLGFGDGMALGRGTMGNGLGRNTPHIYNLAWNTVFFGTAERHPSKNKHSVLL